MRRRPQRSPREPLVRDKTCIVTGGTSGIGEASALALADRGADVAIVCRSETRGADLHTPLAIGQTSIWVVSLSDAAGLGQ